MASGFVRLGTGDDPAAGVYHADVKQVRRRQQGACLELGQRVGLALGLVGVFDQLEGLIDFTHRPQDLRFVGGADFQARLSDLLLRADLFDLDQVQGASPDDQQQQNGQQRKQDVGFPGLVEAAPKQIVRPIGQGVFTMNDTRGRRHYTRPLDRHGLLPALSTADGLRVSDAATARACVVPDRRHGRIPGLLKTIDHKPCLPRQSHADRGFAWGVSDEVQLTALTYWSSF